MKLILFILAFLLTSQFNNLFSQGWSTTKDYLERNIENCIPANGIKYSALINSAEKKMNFRVIKKSGYDDSYFLYFNDLDINNLKVRQNSDLTRYSLTIHTRANAKSIKRLWLKPNGVAQNETYVNFITIHHIEKEKLERIKRAFIEAIDLSDPFAN